MIEINPPASLRVSVFHLAFVETPNHAYTPCVPEVQFAAVVSASVSVRRRCLQCGEGVRMSLPAPLPVEELAHRCDARQFAFATTDELEDIGVIPGQERATDAIELAVGIERDGYNLFVMGFDADLMAQ